MSLKARFRRIEAGVHWLETEGVFRHIEAGMKLLEKLQEISDRIASDPAAAARWKEVGSAVKLPPPSAHLRPRPPDPAVASPPPVLVPPPPPPPLPEAEVPLEPEAQPASVPPRPPPEPEPAARASLPSPDMEIRPVRWRTRAARDDEEEDRPGTYGRSITEYDPLRDADDDYDDDGG